MRREGRGGRAGKRSWVGCQGCGAADAAQGGVAVPRVHTLPPGRGGSAWPACAAAASTGCMPQHVQLRTAGPCASTASALASPQTLPGATSRARAGSTHSSSRTAPASCTTLANTCVSSIGRRTMSLVSLSSDVCSCGARKGGSMGRGRQPLGRAKAAVSAATLAGS